MNDGPLVSIIMNCYNGEEYLREAINSVYAQTYDNWEIIFWDNASTDSSAKIAKSYDEKLKYFKAEKNTCLGEARVHAVNQAQGEYLEFLDCDDIFLPEKTQRQVQQFLIGNNIALVYGRSISISSEGNKIGENPYGYSQLPSGMVFDEMLYDPFVPFVSIMISTKKYHAVGGFNYRYQHSVDYDLFLKLSYRYEFKAIDQCFGKYRQHSKSLSNFVKVVAAKEVIDLISKFLPSEVAKEALSRGYIRLMLANIKEKQYKVAYSVFLEKCHTSSVIKYILIKTIKRVILIYRSKILINTNV